MQSPLENQNLDRQIARWIATKYLPISFFEDASTQQLFKTINPAIKLPDRRKLKDDILTEYELLKKNVCELIKSLPSKLSFTVDGWSSIANRSYYGITGHFIDEQWMLQSLVIDFVPSHGKHTGQDIANIFF